MEVKRIVEEAYTEVKDILTKNKDKLEKLAKLLQDEEIVEGEDFDKLMSE